MQIDLYQIDAFTDTPFSGNPAAVCPLASWLPEETMQGERVLISGSAAPYLKGAITLT